MSKIAAFAALVLSALAPKASFSQSNPHLQTYLRKYIKLTDDKIKSIRSGKAVTKILPSRTPAEIFVFGAIYVRAAPEAYLKLSRDFDRLRNVPGFLAVRAFSSSPRISDLEGFSFENEDIEALKECKPADCDVQMPASYIEDFQKSFDWDSPNATERINATLRETVLAKLTAYQRDGNRALGVYHDKEHPVDVLEMFKYMLSYSKAFPEYLPDFYGYLLGYPQGKPSRTEDAFYWAKVKFGLKPTLRAVHVITTVKEGSTGSAYVIAEKQLYASHYFQTALDLAFCISDDPDSEGRGFYLIKAMGSEQAGLTGMKGSILRKVAVNRSASSLEKSLISIKNTLEHPGHSAPELSRK
jgi:hypothetical protein